MEKVNNEIEKEQNKLKQDTNRNIDKERWSYRESNESKYTKKKAGREENKKVYIAVWGHAVA
jgi:hypothetical protein